MKILIAGPDWTMLAAASVTNNTVSDQLVSGIHAYASTGTAPGCTFPLTVVYDPSTSVQESVANLTVVNGNGVNRYAVKNLRDKFILTR